MEYKAIGQFIVNSRVSDFKSNPKIDTTTTQQKKTTTKNKRKIKKKMAKH